jgi:arylsulfatase A-like enzyme
MLGGGDVDDLNPTVHPARLETLDDQIDNNGIAGDLTSASVELWKLEHQSTSSANPNGPKLNVIFFFIDTLRADHLSSYGYHRTTSPNMDKLASKGSLFENAFTPSPRTSEAVQKFMQSSYWDGHLESWTQVLARNGFKTMLFPGRRSWVRYKEWMPVAPRSQGRHLKENIDVAIETLRELPDDQPFCAFVYIPDPHKPYITHNEHFYGDSVIDQYDGEISYTDLHVGRLLNWVEESGRLDKTMIIIMSDHGESLGERGVYLHSTQLYNEQMKVPLIIFAPQHSARRVSDYVTTVDLGATILDAAGLTYPESRAGVSLMPLIRGELMTHPAIYGEQTSQEISPFVRLDQQVHPDAKKYMVITQDGFKLIFNRDVHSYELFDLRTDSAEVHNLFHQDAARTAGMQQLLGRFVDIVTASRPWDADEGRYSRAGADGDKVED